MLKLAVLALFALSYGHDERLKDIDGNYIGRGCGTQEYNEELLASDPAWKQSLDDFEAKWAETQSKILSGDILPISEELNIAIPIVLHIVDRDPSRVPDNVVTYQMQTLIDDYSANNNDYTSGTPVEFRDVRSGSFNFHIFLDERINRITSVTSFSSNNNVKFDSSGGSNVVSPDSKLNFWACTLSGGLLGYAQFPGGNPSTDGVVNGITTMSPDIGSAPYNLGRTATHEIGHWLNLRHIWGDNTGCTNTELISDFVTDTPPSSSANYGCPNVKRCSQNQYSRDMMCNYMDYVEDNCMVMFTELQKQRAFRSIEQYRGGFSPSLVTQSEIEYINWLYFNRFDEEQDDEHKCHRSYTLFYENNINEYSDSNVYIYGCMRKTNFMSVSHITDIKIVRGNDNIQCEDGYIRATQDLNEGNDGEAIYLCYNKEESDGEHANMAVLDITFIRNDDTAKLDMNLWDVNIEDNINPNGVKLNFAMKKGKYYHDATQLKGSSNGGGDAAVGTLTEKENIYIGIAVGAALLFVSILIGVIIWKYVCSRKGFKEYMNESLANEYGATTELTSMRL